MCEVLESRSEENISQSQFKRHCSLQIPIRCLCLFVLPVCTLLASMIIVLLAPTTRIPGVWLGVGLLLFVLTVLLCLVANVINCCLTESRSQETDDLDSDSCCQNDFTVVVAVSEMDCSLIEIEKI